ncbi:hypothetical protein HanOQP8_Chr06g0228801 [Helianthus annuus]|nr:hypothetical protein HanOQP8_Chr06g0228801 [Helianthus annuus]
MCFVHVGMLGLKDFVKLIIVLLNFLQKIPNWWIWMYYLTPTSWSLNALLTSQYGDVKKEILVFGETKSVEAFIRDYFGYHHDQLPLVFVLLALYPTILASLFVYSVAKLNFQKR